MIILKYICIIIFFIIIFKLINTKETLRELGTLSSLNSASLDEIETLGLGKSRSKSIPKTSIKRIKKKNSTKFYSPLVIDAQKICIYNVKAIVYVILEMQVKHQFV